MLQSSEKTKSPQRETAGRFVKISRSNFTPGGVKGAKSLKIYANRKNYTARQRIEVSRWTACGYVWMLGGHHQGRQRGPTLATAPARSTW